MATAYEESEFVFCDLQAAFRYLRTADEIAARRFLENAYDTFEFLAENPGAGRRRPELGHPGLRSWRVRGFRNYLVFYTEGETVRILRVLHGWRDLHAELS